MRSEEESMSLYEQWRLNPHISVQTQNKIENSTFRSTYNHLFKLKTKPVDDTLLSQNMLSKKTYFTSLKDHIHRLPERPVFFKDRISVSTAPHGNRLGSPAETINSAAKPKSTRQMLGSTSP